MFRALRAAATVSLLVFFATPSLANQWFQIRNPEALRSGMLVHFYDAWGWQVAPAQMSASDSNTYEPAPPRGGGAREQEFMVEVLAAHRSTSDFVVRLITTHVGPEARFLKWSPGASPALRDDPRLDPWRRGREALDPAYQMRLERYLPDDNRFYVTFVGADGTKFYLRSDQTADPQRHRLGFTPAGRSGGATRPPERVVSLPGGGQGYHDFYFDILSTEVTDTLTSAAQPVGPPEEVSSSQRLDAQPDLASSFVHANPSDEAVRVPETTVEYQGTRSEAYEFHWDVGVTLTAEAAWLVGKVTVSVSTNFGEKRGETKTEQTTIRIPIPSVMVPARSQRLASAVLKTTTYKQPFQMQLRRVVRSRTASSADEYVMSIVGDVTTKTQNAETVSWGNPTPYGPQVETAAGGSGSSAAGASGKGIAVISATYGRSCGVPSGNRTIDLAASCDGKSSCEYRIDHLLLGDTAPGCAKDFRATWRCGAGAAERSETVAAEAGGGDKTVTLRCEP